MTLYCDYTGTVIIIVNCSFKLWLDMDDKISHNLNPLMWSGLQRRVVYVGNGAEVIV